MDYFLIMCFQFIGFCCFQIPALKIIDSRSKNESFNDVLNAFWSEDRITIIGSVMILFFQEITHFSVWWYDMPLQNQPITFGFWPYEISYITGTLILSLVLGFMGQAILYGLLGKAGDFIKNKFGTKQ